MEIKYLKELLKLLILKNKDNFTYIAIERFFSRPAVDFDSADTLSTINEQWWR